jgi:hypothetical protein
VSVAASWFAFHAFNSETRYGFGTPESAAAYLETINRDRRDYAPFEVEALTPEQVTEINPEENAEGIDLDALIRPRS